MHEDLTNHFDFDFNLINYSLRHLHNVMSYDLLFLFEILSRVFPLFYEFISSKI